MVKKTEPRPLVIAAERLDEVLTGYDRAAHALLRQTLDSRKNLGKAADLLNEVAGADEKLSAEVQAMVGAIAEARDRQQKIAEQVHARAQEVLTRTEALAPLLTAFEELAMEVRKLGEGAGEVGSSTETLDGILNRVDELGQRAKELAGMAQEKDFADVAAEAHALREQLLAIRRTARGKN